MGPPRGWRCGRRTRTVAALREGLGVLRVGVGDLVDVGAERGDRLDPQPQEVRGVEVEPEAQVEHPLPQLRRVGEVARVPVRVPALHHAVLDHQLDSALAGVGDERREDPLGLAEVLGDASGGVAPDERPHGDAPEGGGGIHARLDVGVDCLSLLGVGVEVVVVVGERGAREPVLGERRVHAVHLGVVEGVGGDVARGERPVAEPRPRCQLEGLVALTGGELGDLLEPPLGHARREEAELQASTSTHCLDSAERRTASVIRVARSPSSRVGSPSGRAPPIAA